MRKLGILVFIVSACTAAPLWAEEVRLDPALAARLNQLETETQALRAELQWLRENPVRLPEVSATPASMSTLAAPPADEEFYTLSQLKTEMKKLAWTKGEFRIVPYGYLWGNMVYENERTCPTNRSYTLFVESPTTHGEDAFHVDGRNTRLGIDVAGPRLWPFQCAKSGGKVEIDFQGDFNSTENRGGVLLRHAYVEIKDDYFRLLAGQTWDIISPLYPNTIFYSVYWDAGNIGYRRAQLRGERFLHFSDTFLLTLQGSLNHSINSDCVSDATFRGEPSDWPVIEGRAAVTLGHRGKGYKPIVLGCSGHIGEVGFDVLGGGGAIISDDVRRRTWSVNGDFDIPLTDRLGLRGEFFAGENLSTFLGGIGQGINRTTLDEIRTHGGWIEGYYYWTPWLHSHVAYGLDDPIDQDIAAGGRLYNQFYFANLCWDVTDKFLLGAEVSQWKTMFNGLRTGDSTRLEFVARYGF